MHRQRRNEEKARRGRKNRTIYKERKKEIKLKGLGKRTFVETREN